MRPLFPSAHHDRFAHSLGVYYLAYIAFKHIKNNTNKNILKGIKLDAYEAPFHIAALMHDCGHSPFSHTFEANYNLDRRAEIFLLKQVDDNFRSDYNNIKIHGEGPADHEIFSAGIFLKHYGAIFKKLNHHSNPLLVARMIVGCIHQPARTAKDEIENCLILLLNGRAIDIDKLDYILRDTWASGVNNVTIDVQRLLSALTISKYDNKLVPAFNKSALSVVQSVIDGRNFLHNWIFSHHAVKYYNEAIQTAVNKLSKHVSPKHNPNKLIDVLFSHESFEKPVKVGTHKIYLPSDVDIYYLLKQYAYRIKSQRLYP